MKPSNLSKQFGRKFCSEFEISSLPFSLSVCNQDTVWHQSSEILPLIQALCGTGAPLWHDEVSTGTTGGTTVALATTGARQAAPAPPSTRWCWHHWGHDRWCWHQWGTQVALALLEDDRWCRHHWSGTTGGRCWHYWRVRAGESLGGTTGGAGTTRGHDRWCW